MPSRKSRQLFSGRHPTALRVTALIDFTLLLLSVESGRFWLFSYQFLLPLRICMSRPVNVLFVSSEVEPFAKTGGLADVSGALPLAIRKLGQEIRIITPRYGMGDEGNSKSSENLALRDLRVPVGEKTYLASVTTAAIGDTNASVLAYLVENQILFGRRGLYVDPETRQDYPDNDERFIFFNRCVMEVLKHLDWHPDIIHCNDWQTGFIPVFLKSPPAAGHVSSRTKTVFTVHNMAYQGVFPQYSFSKTHLPAELLNNGSVSASGYLNCLKAGLVFADTLTTVSRKYAEEIQTDEYGCGLQDIARMRSCDLHGILNGVDYSVWDPSVDEYIPQRYTIRTVTNKKENKRALLAKVGLPYAESTPVIGVISRLADQKGFDLLVPIFSALVSMDVQLVFLGTGELKYHEFLGQAQRAYPRQVATTLAFDTPLAHLIEAGSDMFLMPSRYEPCGLNQIYSLRYGTAPIVRATGGLDDTIEDFQSATGSGTGFKFVHYDSGELLHAIRRALDVFSQKD